MAGASGGRHVGRLGRLRREAGWLCLLKVAMMRGRSGARWSLGGRVMLPRVARDRVVGRLADGGAASSERDGDGNGNGNGNGDGVKQIRVCRWELARSPMLALMAGARSCGGAKP